MSEHFSTLEPQTRTNFDAATVLRDISAAPITTAQSEAAISPFRLSKKQYYKCVITYQEITPYNAGADEWVISVEVSDTDTGTFPTVGSITLGESGTSEIMLSGLASAQIQPDAQWIRVTATPTGSPGALTYSAFLTAV